jgi:hypothetical protein
MSADFNGWKSMPEGPEKYQRYLASREWGLLKEQVRRRAGGKCERCRWNPMHSVHHLTYARKYQELPEDLRGVCNPCHEYEHGKRSRDPILDTPIILFGHTLRSVYLAGPITGDPWRKTITNHDSEHELLDEFWISNNERWPEGGYGGCYLPDKRSLGFMGPMWMSVDSGGHNQDPVPDRQHASVENFATYHGDDAREVVAAECIKAIRRSDLCFAWLPRTDCYGTLVEIGVARQICRVTIVAVPPTFPFFEAWFPLAAASAVVVAETPSEAWGKMWSGDVMSVTDAIIECVA